MSEKIIYKLKKRWKVLIIVSVLFNVLFVTGFVAFKYWGEQQVHKLLLGNNYSSFILSHSGEKKWNKMNAENGYSLKNDFKLQKIEVRKIRKILRKGDVNSADLKKILSNLRQQQDKNYQRFINDFPKFWNELSNKQRNKFTRAKNPD